MGVGELWVGGKSGSGKAWGTSREPKRSAKMAAKLVTLRPGPSGTLGSLTSGTGNPTVVWAIGDQGSLSQEAPRPPKERGLLSALEGGTICPPRRS